MYIFFFERVSFKACLNFNCVVKQCRFEKQCFYSDFRVIIFFLYTSEYQAITLFFFIRTSKYFSSLAIAT